MTTMPKAINWNEQFYKLLRLSLRLPKEFPVTTPAAAWPRYYSQKRLQYAKNIARSMQVSEKVPIFALEKLSKFQRWYE